jgi:hypothetical protein
MTTEMSWAIFFPDDIFLTDGLGESSEILSPLDKIGGCFRDEIFLFFESWFSVPVVVLIASGPSLRSYAAYWRISGQLSFVCNPANFQSPP